MKPPKKDFSTSKILLTLHNLPRKTLRLVQITFYTVKTLRKTILQLLIEKKSILKPVIIRIANQNQFLWKH
nr:MAG TPA: hypothetical protein [Caudoviricetes sp.]